MLAKVVFKGIMQWQMSQVVVSSEYLSQDSQISILSEATLLGANLGFSIKRFAVSTKESFQDILQHCGLLVMFEPNTPKLYPTPKPTGKGRAALATLPYCF